MRTSFFGLAAPCLALCALGCEDKAGTVPRAAGAATPSVSPGTLAAGAPAPAPAKAAAPDPKLDVMKPETLKLEAPANFDIKFETTKGDFVVSVHRDWAPKGADRLYNLVKAGYFKDIAFFRVIQGFMAQFGIAGDPKLARVWHQARIQDDPNKQPNTRGRVTFATAGPNTRTTQLFINFGNNNRLDAMGFAPLGEVSKGMEIVDALHSGYGEGAPRGRGPSQDRLQGEGNPYLKAEFPDLDYIKQASVL